MSQQQNRSGIINLIVLVSAVIVGGFVGVFVLSFTITMIEFILGGLAGIMLASVILFGFKRSEDAIVGIAEAAHAAASAKRYDPVKERDSALNALALQNEKLRTTSSIAPAVLLGAESLIDRLSELVIRLYEEYPSEETTWTIGAVATDHLPELLGRYVSVAADMRGQAEESVLAGIEALTQEVTTISTMLDVSNLEGAKTQADAIKARFGRQDFVNP